MQPTASSEVFLLRVIEFLKSNRPYFEDFITRSTYHSNAIEGSTLSFPETYAILWNDNSMSIKATARELYDAINHKYALNLALDDESAGLRESLIKDVAIQINKNINEVSGYRRVQVMIRGAEHMPPSPQQVIPQMMELVHFYNLDLQSRRDPFEREAEFHIKFERVHPFEDGNGRTGRILLNRGLLLSDIPPAVISIDDRARYLNLIAQQDVKGMVELLRGLSHAEGERIKAFER